MENALVGSGLSRRVPFRPRANTLPDGHIFSFWGELNA